MRKRFAPDGKSDPKKYWQRTVQEAALKKAELEAPEMALSAADRKRLKQEQARAEAAARQAAARLEEEVVVAEPDVVAAPESQSVVRKFKKIITGY